MSTDRNRDVDILLVEDHADTQAALFDLLTGQGYAVLSADNGQRALDMLERGLRPRLILLDLMLPRVSGWDLLQVLHSDPELRVIPIVVVTGAGKDQVNVVADAVFHKPLQFDVVLSKVRELITKNVSTY